MGAIFWCRHMASAQYFALAFAHLSDLAASLAVGAQLTCSSGTPDCLLAYASSLTVTLSAALTLPHVIVNGAFSNTALLLDVIHLML